MDPQKQDSEDRYSPRQRLLLAMLACLATTILAAPLRGILDPANMVMLFLLTVLLVAVSLGRQAAVLASVLGVVLFDVFFVPPHFSLAVSNLQYLITFAVMLATALITTHLAAGLKQKAREAEIRERQTRALYEAARELAGTLTCAQVAEIAGRFVEQQFHACSCLLSGDETGAQAIALSGKPRTKAALVTQAIDSRQRTADTEAGDGEANLYLPLNAPMRLRGVLAIALPAQAQPHNLALLEALSSLLAIALERLHYVEVAQNSQLEMATERLRSSILSALSHDLRTPLTALGGLAESFHLIKPPLPASALDTANSLHEQAVRLSGLVDNLLDMARLNAGDIRLRREWQPLEEVIGASLKLLGSALSQHPVHVRLPADLPLLAFDAILLERVFCNLLDNAGKYSPPGTPIEITARRLEGQLEIEVSDHGPGLGSDDPEALFALFVRAGRHPEQPGSGLGLAICRAIVEAHGGEIHAANRPDGGTRVYFTLPLGNPPVIEEELP